jgi:tetratricopeptide (TPR) repeat protein
LFAVSQGDDQWLTFFKEAHNLQVHEQYREAVIVYSSALEAAEMLGPDELPVAIVANNLGYSREQLGDIRVATRLYTKALSIFERKLPVGDPRLLEEVMNLSSAYLASDEISRADALLRRFLTIGDSLKAEQRATLIEELGTVALRRGNFREAKQMYEESLAVFVMGGIYTLSEEEKPQRL